MKTSCQKQAFSLPSNGKACGTFFSHLPYLNMKPNKTCMFTMGNGCIWVSGGRHSFASSSEQTRSNLMVKPRKMHARGQGFS